MSANWVRSALRRLLSPGWVPLAASLLSLLVSITALVISTRDPEVQLILPDQVRVTQAIPGERSFLYLQPSFVSTGQNERVEVIRGMALRVSNPDGATGQFEWDEQGQLLYDSATKRLTYGYVADAVPMVVSARTAQVPLSLFLAPSGWTWRAGTYRATLTATRTVVESPLEASFDFTLSSQDVDALNRARGDLFLELPVMHR